MNNGGPVDRHLTAGDELAFGPNDVLSGRTKLSFNHIGNRRFREVVAQSIDDYNSAQSRAEKYGIVETIMDEIAKSDGRFLKEDDDGNWLELEPDTVRQKIAHAIRDTTKKKEAKRLKALQQFGSRDRGIRLPTLAKSSATVPPRRPPAKPKPDLGGITSLVQGLDQYRKNMQSRSSNARTQDDDNDDDGDTKMPAFSTNMGLPSIPQKLPFGLAMGDALMEGMERAPCAPKSADILGGVDAAMKPLGMGLDNFSMKPKNRYQLRPDDQGLGLLDPGSLRPGGVGTVALPKEPPATLLRSDSTPHQKEPPGELMRSDTHEHAGLAATMSDLSEPPYHADHLSPGLGAHDDEGSFPEEPPLAHDEDDFLSKINQLPGLSDHAD
ncbi:expressed unknown protein [Seminavis robusta]|uniref:DUF6824 domain-containing protein n=1 Tax=Seminavis robusta TaxID=568900 RepID=A0A9N8H2R6_9STRA|nr:expressed unknown protein [Seminavis robusta]|eukprot:Sro23_g015960.1 n/a (382) ;mRNA; f:120547-121788